MASIIPTRCKILDGSVKVKFNLHFSVDEFMRHDEAEATEKKEG